MMHNVNNDGRMPMPAPSSSEQPMDNTYFESVYVRNFPNDENLTAVTTPPNAVSPQDLYFVARRCGEANVRYKITQLYRAIQDLLPSCCGNVTRLDILKCALNQLTNNQAYFLNHVMDTTTLPQCLDSKANDIQRARREQLLRNRMVLVVSLIGDQLGMLEHNRSRLSVLQFLHENLSLNEYAESLFNH